MDNENSRNIADLIFEWRVDNDLTQVKAAEILGVTPLMITRYETGKSVPTKKNYYRFERIIKNYSDRR